MGPTILTLHFYFLKTWEKTFKRKMKLSFVTLFLAADAGAAARKERNALAAAQRKAANAVLAQIAAQRLRPRRLQRKHLKMLLAASLLAEFRRDLARFLKMMLVKDSEDHERAHGPPVEKAAL